MVERFGEVKRRLLELAKDNGDIKAIIEIGSQARSSQPADQYSDLDIILIAASHAMTERISPLRCALRQGFTAPVPGLRDGAGIPVPGKG